MSLTLHSFVLTLSMLGFFIYVALTLSWEGRGKPYYDLQKMVVVLYSDFFALVNPFSLILLSAGVQQQVAKFLADRFCRKVQVGRAASVQKSIGNLLVAFCFLFFFVIVCLIAAIFDVYANCTARDYVWMDFGGDRKCLKRMKCR